MLPSSESVDIEFVSLASFEAFSLVRLTVPYALENNQIDDIRMRRQEQSVEGSPHRFGIQLFSLKMVLRAAAVSMGCFASSDDERARL